MKKINQQKNKGFSLVELMVSVSIFALVMVFGMSAMLSVVEGNRKSQSLQVAINNLSYAVENMSRRIVTGDLYRTSSLSGTCSLSGWVGGIVFTGSDLIDYEYWAESGTLMVTGAAVTSNVTAPEIVIEEMCFKMVGNSLDGGGNPNDGLQASVLIYIKGKAKSKVGTESTFAIQTSATKRNKDE